MDTVKTRDELVAMALDELQAVGAGQTADVEDADKVDSRVDGLLGELASRGVLYVANEDEIPAEYCGPLAELLANECAPAFGRQKNPNLREDAESRLRVMVQRAIPSNRLLQTDPMLRGSGHLTYNRWLRGL